MNQISRLYKYFRKKIFKRRIPKIVHRVRDRNLTYLDEEALFDLHLSAKLIEKLKIKGAIIEAGCALGGSSIVLASAKNSRRHLFVYDVFGMIPSPGENDGNDVLERFKVINEGKSKGINGEEYYGYKTNLFENVISNFGYFNFELDKHNIHLVKGLYQDSLKVNFPVALAHIDCDWYDSVMICLNQIVPNLTKNGVLVIDDYNFWSGCKKAVDDYFLDKREDFDFLYMSRLHIKKK
jgi:hypothetical protein